MRKTETPGRICGLLLPMLLGVDSNDAINHALTASIGKMLPLPLDTSESLRDTIAAILPILLPFNNSIATASVSKVIENLLKAMNVDVNALASQTMTVLLKQMLSPMAKDNTVVQSVFNILPKNISKTFNETLSQMAKDLGSNLPVNSTKQLMDGTIRQMLPGDAGNIPANTVGSFLGLNVTREIASIVNFDPNKPVPELMAYVMGILQQCDKGLCHFLAAENFFFL